MTGGLPAVPVMDQVTAVFVVPDTAAENGKESPARMLAVGGETETWMPAGGGGWLFGAELPAHPAKNSIDKRRLRWNGLRILPANTRRPEPVGLVWSNGKCCDTGQKDRCGRCPGSGTQEQVFFGPATSPIRRPSS